MKMYDIIKLQNSEYASLVIICNAKSPVDYLSSIYSELKEKNISGKIVIDEILHVGNNNKRFISFNFNSTESIEQIELNFVNIKKDNELRKITCDYLRENNLLEYSILTSIQKRMITKGISI